MRRSWLSKYVRIIISPIRPVVSFDLNYREKLWSISGGAAGDAPEFLAVIEVKGHHRPDRRDDDADVLRKPGPPHLRRPRDPDPQTARRGRRNEVVSPDRKTIQRRDA